MGVSGVSWIDLEESDTKPNRFRRWGANSRGEFDAGLIDMG